MDKLKVLQVNKLYTYKGGIEKVVQQLSEGLKEKVDMEVLVCRERGRTIREHVNGVPVTRAGSLGVLFSLPISFSFLWHLRMISKDKDIIHFHMPFPLGDLGCLLSGYRGKVVVWWHSDIVRQKKIMMLYKPIMEMFLKRADMIIVATDGHINGSEFLPKYRNKCVVIPYGVDQEISNKADLYLQCNKRYHNKKVRFLFVGRLVYYKGCDILIKAFKQIQGAELVIVGSGDLEGILRNQAKQDGIELNVNFMGMIDDNALSKEFERCDVFVLPSVAKSEAFGLVQIEAMAYGKPVINTKLPSGVPYVSLDKITGLTVEPSSVDELARAMQWMVDHEKDRLKMGERARLRVKEHYCLDNMLNYVYEVYIKNTSNNGK